MNDEAIANVEALRNSMVKGRPIEEIEEAWNHFYLLEEFCSMYWPYDRAIMQTLRNLERGLSTFTAHVREGTLSPSTSFRPYLTAMLGHLESDYGEDGRLKH